jgi:hypothetical protein
MDGGHTIAETHDCIIADKDAEMFDELERKLCPIDGTCRAFTYKMHSTDNLK